MPTVVAVPRRGPGSSPWGDAVRRWPLIACRRGVDVNCTSSPRDRLADDDGVLHAVVRGCRRRQEEPVSDPGGSDTVRVEQGSRRLMVLLAMAMFVLVVDTSLMNVS